MFHLNYLVFAKVYTFAITVTQDFTTGYSKYTEKNYNSHLSVNSHRGAEAHLWAGGCALCGLVKIDRKTRF